jgi:hypothetical protein
MAFKAQAVVTTAAWFSLSPTCMPNKEITVATEKNVINPTQPQTTQAAICVHSISLSFLKSAQASLSGNYSNKLVRQHPPAT